MKSDCNLFEQPMLLLIVTQAFFFFFFASLLICSPFESASRKPKTMAHQIIQKIALRCLSANKQQINFRQFYLGVSSRRKAQVNEKHSTCNMYLDSLVFRANDNKRWKLLPWLARACVHWVTQLNEWVYLPLGQNRWVYLFL